MTSKTKTILATVVCTTLGWILVLGCLVFALGKDSGPVQMGTFCFYSGTNAFLVATWPCKGDPNSGAWEPQAGTFLVQLVSSNATSSAVSVLYS